MSPSSARLPIALVESDCMTILKPRARASKATRWLVLLTLFAFAGSAVLGLVGGQLTLSSFAQFLLSALVVSIVAAAMVLEDKRARSIEMTSESVTSLVWKRTPGLVPYRLVPLTIHWSDLKQVAQKGLLVSLRDSQGAISVNTYLFDKPDEVLEFINQHAARARSMDL